MPKDNQADADITHDPVHAMRAATSKALQKIKEWSGILAPPPENV